MPVSVDYLERTDRKPMGFFESFRMSQRPFRTELQHDLSVNLAGRPEFGEHLVDVMAA